uniref:Mitochondrial fission regulator 2 n=1 Tax=Haemonchus contortus TaxID=6289 RepID=A0A7I4YH63_HAECO
MACSPGARLVKDATSSSGSPKVCLSLSSDRSKSDKYLGDDNEVDFGIHVNESVARTTASGIELLMLYIEAEIRRIRMLLRDYGYRIRRFCLDSMHIDFRRMSQLFATLSRRVEHVSMSTSDLKSDEAMILNEIPLRSRWKPPKYTFNDIAIVLTSDEEVEDGVVHGYSIRFPAWDRLPSPVLPQHDSESNLKDFQLFNCPMKMAIPTEDEDERFSLPSTMATDQELKIQSLEAQLALLSKQMQTLLAGKIPPPVPAERSYDSSPLLSDDEGKGTSLCSPSDTINLPGANRGSTAPPSAAIPPPPPPPPPSLLSAHTTSITGAGTPSSKRTVLQMLNKSTNMEHGTLPLRPSASELLTVQLKKTDTVRSPGGTPVVRQSKLTPNDEGNYLANALREKFRSLQETLSEHEDDVNSSWVEDEL